MPKNLSQKQLIIIGTIVVLAIIIGVVLFLSLRPHASTATATKLTVWGTEDKGEFQSLVSSYPYGTVTYTQINPASYQTQLLSALAAGTGPDVFEISNRELPKWQSVIAPIPAPLSAQFGILQLQNEFPDVVSQDFVSGGQIYGLPLSIDTLAMLYNKDLFNSAGIAIPPTTWDYFDNDIVKLRSVNAQGQLTQAAAAIGGSENSIPNATDILSLLMLQNGTPMTDAGNTTAQFAAPSGPGVTAFNFYLQFANAASPNYTWNDSLGNSVDSFVAGNTAIIFGYESDLAAIKAKAPFLKVGIAPMPQATGASVAVNYPKYSGFVAAKAGQIAVAWNFIIYLTVTSGDGKIYTGATGAPPALRTDIQADLQDPGLSVFASQALTAKSWYEVGDSQIDGILNSAILNVSGGNEDSTKALTQAQTAVDALMNKR